MNTPMSFHLTGLNTAVAAGGSPVYAISPLDLQIDAQRDPKPSRGGSQSPSNSPFEGKSSGIGNGSSNSSSGRISSTGSSPQAAAPQTDSFSHWDWNPFVASSGRAECLACGYRYGSVEELADHQRSNHGLAEVVF